MPLPGVTSKAGRAFLGVPSSVTVTRPSNVPRTFVVPGSSRTTPSNAAMSAKIGTAVWLWPAPVVTVAVPQGSRWNAAAPELELS